MRTEGSSSSTGSNTPNIAADHTAAIRRPITIHSNILASLLVLALMQSLFVDDKIELILIGSSC
jgi:hypothetical protein